MDVVDDAALAHGVKQLVGMGDVHGGSTSYKIPLSLAHYRIEEYPCLSACSIKEKRHAFSSSNSSSGW